MSDERKPPWCPCCGALLYLLEYWHDGERPVIVWLCSDCQTEVHTTIGHIVDQFQGTVDPDYRTNPMWRAQDAAKLSVGIGLREAT